MANERMILRQNCFFVFTCFLSLIYYTKCDLPVHCLVSDVAGEWVYRINKEVFNPVINNKQTSCGHDIPNNPKAPDHEQSFTFNSYTDLVLTIGTDYKIYEGGVKVGTWTPVYDQSFVLFYKDSVITAPYSYYKDSNGGQKSNCSKSMIGWYVPNKNENNKNWSCFYAFKKKMSSNYATNFLQFDVHVNTPVLTQLSTNSRLTNNVKYEQLGGVVDHINSLNLSWKAAVHTEFVGLSFLQLREKLGLKKGMNNKTLQPKMGSSSFIQIAKTDTDERELKEFLEKINKEEAEISKIGMEEHKTNTFSQASMTEPVFSKPTSTNTEPTHDDKELDSQYVNDYSEVSKYINKSLNEIDENKLPRNWDWRNVGGSNFVPAVKKQGHCGSCYVFSAVTTLEARLRVLTNNKDSTPFSKQFPLSCNFYSEGCDGGYPYLVGKFFSEFEIAPESCFPYTQENSECSNVCDYTKNPKKYTVSKYEYLGGYYGATSEALMMKELRARGPIPGNIQVPWTFNYYKSGIFSSKGLNPNNDKISKVTMVDTSLSWTKVEHSITLVGYGEEKGVKYWIGMNTWGDNWGENGFFKILRGENESAVETMGDALHIKVEDRFK